VTGRWIEAARALRIELLVVGIVVDVGRVWAVQPHHTAVPVDQERIVAEDLGVAEVGAIDVVGDQVLAAGRQAAVLESAADLKSAVVQEGIGLEAIANNAPGEFEGPGSRADLEVTGIADVARAHIAELVFVLAELADTGCGVVGVEPALADAQTEGLETGNCCKAEQPPSWLGNNILNF